MVTTSLQRLKDLEVSLCQLEEERKFLLDAIDAGVWTWNLETDDLYWNDRMFTLFGKSKESFTGKVDFFFECLHPCERERVGIEVQRAVADNTHFTCKYKIVTEEGELNVILAFGRADDKHMRGICLPYPEGEILC
jgi:PAS domain-containing protein